MNNMEKINGNLVYIPIERLHPHPDNPRKDLGDLTELADSIKANGIFQNLTVVPFDGDYRIIIGHRRCAASKLAGLTEAPCVITEMTPKEQLSTMLLENMQRNDLTVYEQAQGFQLMMDLGSTVEEIAEKSGFSKTTVKRRLKMAELDQTVLKEVSTRQLSLLDFDKLAQIEDIGARNKCLEKIGTADFNRNVEGQLRKQAIKKKLPAIKKILKEAKAKAIKANDRWSSKFDSVGAMITIYDWDEKETIIPKSLKGQVYYFLDEDYGSVRFYQEHQKAKPAKKSQAEIDKAKAIAAAWEQAKEIRAVTHTLRLDFIKGITLNAKNQTAILKGAAASIVFRCVDYCGANRELLCGTLGYDDSHYDVKRGENVYKAFEDMSAKGYPMLVYANFGDAPDLNYIKGYSGEWPRYEPNARCDALYAWLCSLGYEMSDEEKALQNGTHKLFDAKEEEVK